MTLKKYNQKRNFTNTPEPAGENGKNGTALSFVVQRHDASHLHYDFRLEVDGVLKSWAVPKGPSLNPSDKRLAVMVEDHPIKYGSFAGEIPAGNYGAGTVEIWDKGTYEPEVKTDNPEKEIRKELASGSLKFRMHGEQLNGSFALVAMKNSDRNWLLIKHKDEFAEVEPYNIEDHPSVSRGQAPRKSAARSSKMKADVRSVRSSTEKVDHFISPMLATLGDKPFDGDDWIFEIKWDGYRAVAELGKKTVKLYSRNGLSFSSLYPDVAKELGKLGISAVLDGEIVAVDEIGKPDFQKLQNHGQAASKLLYYVFDCLSYNGKDLTGLPLLERKQVLQDISPQKNATIRYSDHATGEGIAFFGQVVTKGLEGMMAKKSVSVYTPGKRSNDWLKIKNQNTQEAVIAGFTAPRNSRKYFGSLVLGMYKNKKLTYLGHTGTGFSDRILRSVYEELAPLIAEKSPFDHKIPMREKVTWVTPKKVCNVKFSELTNDGILRHPVFMGMRIDKTAKEVDHIDKPIASGEKVRSKPLVKSAHANKIPVKPQPAARPKTDKSQGKGLVINGHKVLLTHPDKIYFPDAGITKGDVVAYYRSMSKFILPYLKDRPESLKRNPGGIADKGFFHKDAAGAAPDWVDHISLHSDAARKDIDYILCNNEATLAYLNNLGCIEINPWNSTIKSLNNPDYLIIDIDPSEKNTFDQVIEVALAVEKILKRAAAQGYPKTSGATGMHIYIPLKAAYTYDQIRMFAEALATMVVDELPKIATIERSLAKRKNRIYVDYLQNKKGQTLSSVYSLRPVGAATVSTPLDWKEVKAGLLPSKFTIHTIGQRVKKVGDLFSPVLKQRTDLEKCLKNLGF